MKFPLDLVDLNRKRILRAGKDLWERITSIQPDDVIPAILAEKFMDVYGIRPSDLIFFLSVMGASIDMEPFYEILIERANRLKPIKCDVND